MSDLEASVSLCTSLTCLLPGSKLVVASPSLSLVPLRGHGLHNIICIPELLSPK